MALEKALKAPETSAEVMESIRANIDRIVLTPGGADLSVVLHSDLATILALCDAGSRKRELPDRRGVDSR